MKIECNFLDEKIDDKRKTVKALQILHIRQSQFQSMYDSGRHHKVRNAYLRYTLYYLYRVSRFEVTNFICIEMIEKYEKQNIFYISVCFQE